jgi:hypothetical protein
MTDRAQFEAMLEALINEDHDQAKEIFHQIVVGKSREIYEELLAEDFDADTMNKGVNGEHKSDTDEDMEEEEMEEEDTEEEESAGDEESDDSEDDAEDDGEENPFGDEEGEEDGEEGEGDIEDRVMDLEDALEDLKAEFEQLLQGEEHEEETGMAGDHGGALDNIEADMGGMDEPEDESVMHHVHHVMEYVNKVAPPKHGDNGVNTKSAVAGKNDMGGTTANIAKNFSTTSGGTQGGLLAPTAKEENFGNVNVPGGKAGKTGFKKQEPGHGAEKKGKSEAGVDKKSLIGGKVR